MTVTRVFQSGNSQTIRLPQDFHLTVDQVEIFRRGDEIILRPASINGAAIFDALSRLAPDFMPEERDYKPPQEREMF